ncbi:aldehyde dehydrogenase family protein [Nocardia sp. SYP-A9097]|uniref:aminobutyraldehyde dehydrogenase n=1 Tax=Nocardia sp. SYP-A9097 TaxID=2663237 RepID=UPI00129B4B9A|nr:aminobutyraldehyde dehydrogenase [Nocardia sp. SYP-A9097]MRH90093.1 aldehyde dehydrogenase family protein [Nocardia sp. SYP-A9097]
MIHGTFVNGRLIAGSGESAKMTDPATAEIYDEISQSGLDQVEAAAAAADAAGRGWAAATPRERAQVLLKFADALEADTAELSRLEVQETGRPHHFMQHIEVPMATDNVRYFAGMARSDHGTAAGEFSAGFTSMLRRRPIGTVAGIAPWNFPLIIGLWKVVPALAAGNAVILKPAMESPGSSLRAAQLAIDAGLPAGLFNVVTGGAEIGAALVRNPSVEMVSVTGSTETGKSVMRTAAEAPKKVHLELGGKGAAIVFDDADISAMAASIAFAACYNTGQDCTAATRVYIHRSIFEDAVEAIRANMRSFPVGDPYDPASLIGPLISERHRERVEGFVFRAQTAGAQLVTGGKRIAGPGFYFEPTLITGADQQSEIVQREVFGPVLVALPFDDEDQAVALANGTDYGLASSVWTLDGSRGHRIAQHLDVGVTWINDHLPLTSEMPHGGVKRSGFGKDMGSEALLEYSTAHHVMTRNMPSTTFTESS